MSHEPSDPAASIKAAQSSPDKSRKSPKSRRFPTPDRVFANPEYQVPFQLKALGPGRGRGKAVARYDWLEIAVRSGLAVMVLPNEEPKGHAVTLLEPLDGHPPARLNRPLSEILADGIANTLYQLDQLGKKK
jgi:hypothetical protein